MKVSNNMGPQLNGLDATKSKATEDVKASKANALNSEGSVDGSAKVNLSEQAQLMQKAKAIASADTVDEAKVARLQAMIDSGEYRVDADAVADRLVDEHLLFPT